MTLLPVFQAAEIVEITPGEMWFHPIVFGVITFVIFLALMGVTFSFRNMAASHPVNPTVTKYEPVGHPGHPVIESDAGAAHRTHVEPDNGSTSLDEIESDH